MYNQLQNVMANQMYIGTGCISTRTSYSLNFMQQLVDQNWHGLTLGLTTTCQSLGAGSSILYTLVVLA